MTEERKEMSPKHATEGMNRVSAAFSDAEEVRMTPGVTQGPEMIEPHARDGGNVKEHTLDRLDSFIRAVDGKRLTYARLIA